MDPSLPLHLSLTVRARRALARKITRRAVVAVAAVVTAVAVSSIVRSAEQARSRWADTRQVAVAERDLAPGDTVDAGAVVLRTLPSAAVAGAASGTVPLGAVVRYPIAAGEPVVAGRLAPQGLTGVAALVPEGHRAVAVPSGPAGTPPVQLGDRVDIVALTPTSPDYAHAAEHGHPPPPTTPEDRTNEPDDPAAETDVTTDPTEPGPTGAGASPDAAEPPPETAGLTDHAGSPATTLVDGALVVDVTDTTITVAVPQVLAPAVAYAATQGLAVLLLRGP